MSLQVFLKAHACLVLPKFRCRAITLFLLPLFISAGPPILGNSSSPDASYPSCLLTCSFCKNLTSFV